MSLRKCGVLRVLRLWRESPPDGYPLGIGSPADLLQYDSKRRTGYAHSQARASLYAWLKEPATPACEHREFTYCAFTVLNSCNKFMDLQRAILWFLT